MHPPPYLPLSVSLCLSLILSRSRSLSLSVYLSLSVSPSLSLSLSRSLSFYVCLSLSLSLSLALSRSLSRSLSLCLFSMSLLLSLSLSLPLSLALSPSLSLALSRSLTIAGIAGDPVLANERGYGYCGSFGRSTPGSRASAYAACYTVLSANSIVCTIYSTSAFYIFAERPSPICKFSSSMRACTLASGPCLRIFLLPPNGHGRCVAG